VVECAVRAPPPAGHALKAGVAQLVEQLIRNQQVLGSSPSAGSKNSSVIESVHRRVEPRREPAQPASGAGRLTRTEDDGPAEGPAGTRWGGAWGLVSRTSPRPDGTPGRRTNRTGWRSGTTHPGRTSLFSCNPQDRRRRALPEPPAHEPLSKPGASSRRAPRTGARAGSVRLQRTVELMGRSASVCGGSGLCRLEHGGWKARF
jgi:hypothetical protein